MAIRSLPHFSCVDNTHSTAAIGAPPEWIPDLHFETCYFAPIEYCIANGFSRFEAGAQGEHKLSRGLCRPGLFRAPWLSHSGFHDAVGRYTAKNAGTLSVSPRYWPNTLRFPRG
ncbi:MAG: hypothetical protein Ct9H300mP16_07960 [Pseudomonadota bacterium]|nr:MAG: hypothetical protein Ct9H300mP16_07960 [Pseudomonadota bacterium]